MNFLELCFRYKNNLISWYDEQYNHRKREEGDQLPDLRQWDGHTLSWAPERTDYPMQGTICLKYLLVVHKALEVNFCCSSLFFSAKSSIADAKTIFIQQGLQI